MLHSLKQKKTGKAKKDTIPTYPKYHFSNLHPGRLTWNLQMSHLESNNYLNQTSMTMFHVNLQVYHVSIVGDSPLPKLHQGALSRVSSRSTSNLLQAWRKGRWENSIPTWSSKFGAGWLMQ